MTLLYESVRRIRRTVQNRFIIILLDSANVPCVEDTHIAGVVVKRGGAIFVEHAGVAVADTVRAIILLHLRGARTASASAEHRWLSRVATRGRASADMEVRAEVGEM